MDILKNFNVTRYEGSLVNGIKITLFYRPGAPITTTAILRSGSKYDPYESLGLSHFIEHMIMNGSPEFPSKDLLSEHIESVGGSYSASTNQDFLFVNTEISDKEDYGRVGDIFNVTLCRPLLGKEKFENEKQIVINEIRKSNSNPNQMLNNTAIRLFFKNTPFGHEVMGNEQSISKLGYDEMISQHKKLFDKSRITFVSSGDISLEEITSHLNKLIFLEGNTFNEINKELEPTNANDTLATFLDTPHSYICFGVPAPDLLSKEYLHLNLLGSILAGGRASRLTKILRYNRGLIYNVSHGRVGGLQHGYWKIVTDTSEDMVQEVINIIVNEIKNISQVGIKDSELNFVKNRSLKSLKRTMQTSGDWVNFHSVAETQTQKYDINTYSKIVQATTTDDIKKVIDKYLGLDNWQLALCGRNKAESININL